ncbi:MAG: hypothetical protein KF774_20180 [Planctomyces sp.]|nr:hypothetical protein [Planctomyces sp.]
MAIGPLRIVAAFGLVVACGIAGAGGWMLLHSQAPKGDAQTSPDALADLEQIPPEPESFAHPVSPLPEEVVPPLDASATHSDVHIHVPPPAEPDAVPHALDLDSGHFAAETPDHPEIDFEAITAPIPDEPLLIAADSDAHPAPDEHHFTESFETPHDVDAHDEHQAAHPFEAPPDAAAEHADAAHEADDDDDGFREQRTLRASPRPAPQTPAARRSHRKTAELVRADQYLRAGDLAAAMKIYAAEIQQSSPSVDPVVYFRWALCAESLGLLDEAAARYQDLSRLSPTAEWRGFALWGLSRVLHQQKRPDLALRGALEVWLTQDQSAAAWKPDLAHWMAHLQYRRTLGNASADLLEDEAFADSQLVIRTHDLLALCSQIHARDLAALPGAIPEILAEAPPPTPPPADLSRISLPRVSVAETLAHLSRAMNASLRFQGAAQRLAESRVCRVEVVADVPAILDALCEAHGLMWAVVDGELLVEAAGDAPEDRVRQFRIDATTRSLNRAVRFERTHRWAADSQLALARMTMVQQEPALARQALIDLIADHRQSQVLGAAWFNLGKVHLHAGLVHEAIDAFERAVDHSAGTSLEATGDLFLGRMLLESGQPRKAIPPLHRAVALSQARERPTAILTLAAAHLAADRPESANVVLREGRAELSGPATYDATAFLSALSQARAARDQFRRKYDQRTLMQAVSHVDASNFFGWQGAALIASAYLELGLVEEADEICRDATSRMRPCALRSQLELLLVESALGRGQTARAREILQPLTAFSEPAIRADANRKLCALLLQTGETDAALRLAIAWLNVASSAEEQTTALRTLGRCLEQRGDRINAALCFAGSRPGPDALTFPDPVE